MKRKTIIDFIINLALLIVASCIILLPIFEIKNIKYIMIFIFSMYSIFKLTHFILTMKEKDNESIVTCLISLGCLISLFFININYKTLSLVLMVWLGLMSLNKLKKADFYHDRKNKMWILRIIMLFVFLTIGLITLLNLFNESNIQIILIGYFFFINSLLDLIEPVVVYIAGEK